MTDGNKKTVTFTTNDIIPYNTAIGDAALKIDETAYNVGIQNIAGGGTAGGRLAMAVYRSIASARADSNTSLNILPANSDDESDASTSLTAPVLNSIKSTISLDSVDNLSTTGFSGGYTPYETKADLYFIVTSGSSSMVASGSIEKGGFRHISAVLDRKSNVNSNLRIYLSGNLLCSSSDSVDMGYIGFAERKFTIGSGSVHHLGSYSSTPFIPTQTFSGSLDELRVWHKPFISKQIKVNMYKSVYRNPFLKLYFKFNEATGSYTSNNVCLDSSGNSLHTLISNFNPPLRIDSALKNPMLLENERDNPVLFPSNLAVSDLNVKLLNSASLFDANNPNLITKLIPAHYLQLEAFDRGFADEEGNIGDTYPYRVSFPGGGQLNSPQIIASLLFTWARFFDEIKLFIDQFGNLLKIDYNTEGTLSDQFIPFFANYYGFDLPNFYTAANYSQYHLGEDLTANTKISKRPLKKLQNEIWRRILINFNEIIKSKGTTHSVKALIRASGIDPDSNFRFREFGGSIFISTKDKRRKTTKTAASLILTGTNPRITSPFLSASRIEPGYPFIVGSFVNKLKHPPHGISNNKSDGLLTSGSWTFEGTYNFGNLGINPPSPHTQSLVHFYSTGSSAYIEKNNALISNLIAYGPGKSIFETGSLIMYSRPAADNDAPLVKLFLTGVNIFDGSDWHISFGRDIGSSTGSYATSSYFLRAGKQSGDRLSQYHFTSSFVFAGDPTQDIFSNISTNYNSLGTFFKVGSSSLKTTITDYFLNSSTKTPGMSRYFAFGGKIINLRFWSKALSLDEDKEHTRNFESLGVENPNINFNFVTKASGSFERLRIDAGIEQPVTKSGKFGDILIFDFSQSTISGSRGAPWWGNNNKDKKYFHLSGSGFATDTQVINPHHVVYSTLNPKWDEREVDNKVRVRGFEQTVNIKEFNSLKSPVRKLEVNHVTEDNNKFSIEVSAVRALNEDMIKILASLDYFDNAIGPPEMMFADNYPELRKIREIYFNRLEKEINFKNLFEFYKWFDDSLSILIEKLIPNTTTFLGINFVIESHIFERARMEILDSRYVSRRK